MPERRFPEIADIADRVKRRLFNRLRDATQSINYLDYQEYKRAFGAIPDLLLAEWAKIREELKEEPKLRERLRGYLFEALFYYACLDVQASFMDADLAEFGGAEFGESAPWFEATPLYDIIPTLHHVKEGKIRKRRVPQTGADFLITYVGDSGPLAPSLVDVKSVKPKDWDSKWGWEIAAALRRGFRFELAYPASGIEHPENLDEWELVTPCSNCKKVRFLPSAPPQRLGFNLCLVDDIFGNCAIDRLWSTMNWR